MMQTRSKIRAAAILLVALGTGWFVAREQSAARPAMQPAAEREVVSRQGGSRDPAQDAFEQRASDRLIAVDGVVERILADDRDGSPHQRFIVRTPAGLSLLVAHNLDLAPRLDGLARGDRVTVRGEYEWNEKGGVMHWTHDDPQGRHEAGYIEWRGRRYQ
jgi:Protein of unknown function (DUF3465)